MVRKNNIILLLFLLVAVVFTGCKSTRSVLKDKNTTDLSLADIEKMPAVQGGLSAFSAKMKLSANASGSTFSSQGTIKVKEGEGVQLSIVPLGLFEAARVEFSPLYVLVINRLKKEYSIVHYSNISILEQLGLNHALLESVLQNRVYIPGSLPVGEALQAMDITAEGDTLVLSSVLNGITYRYYIEKATGLLLKSTGTHSNGTAVTCVYEGFQPVGEKMHSHCITLTLAGAEKPVELSFLLSKVKEDYDYNATSPSSSYKKVGIVDLIQALSGK